MNDPAQPLREPIPLPAVVVATCTLESFDWREGRRYRLTEARHKPMHSGARAAYRWYYVCEEMPGQCFILPEMFTVAVGPAPGVFGVGKQTTFSNV